MGCKLSTAYPRGLRFKRKKNKLSKINLGEKPAKEDPNRSSPTADASGGFAMMSRSARRTGNWSAVGIGGSTRSGDMLCPVERPNQIPQGLMETVMPHGQLIARRDEFGFANVEIKFPKYRIQESASSLDLSADRSNAFGNSIVTNASFRPTFNGHGFNRPRQDHGQQQESVFRRRLLSVRAEKKEMEKNLDLWMQRQKEKEKEKNATQ